MPIFNIYFNGKSIIRNNRLGLVRQDADFSKNLRLEYISPEEKISDEYVLVQGKKKKCSNQANRKIFYFRNSDGKQMDIIFQISNTGVAFRYQFPGKTDTTLKILKEATSYHFDTSTSVPQSSNITLEVFDILGH